MYLQKENNDVKYAQMKMLPYPEQVAAFEAIESNCVMHGAVERNHLHIPAVIDPQRISDIDLVQWLSDQAERQRSEQAAQDAHIDKARYGILPAVTDGLVGVQADGSKEYYGLKNGGRHPLVTPDIAEGLVLLRSTIDAYEPNDTLLVQAGATGDDFDTKVTHVEAVYTDDATGEIKHERGTKIGAVLDVDSRALFDDTTEDVIEGLRLPGYGGPSARQKAFIKQIRTLSGHSNGFELQAMLPYVVLARTLAQAALERSDIVVSFDWNIGLEHLELRFVEQAQEQRAVTHDVNIDSIQGDIEFFQSDFGWNFALAGKAVVSGETFRLGKDISIPVPEGAIVMIDDEFEMSRVPPVVFAPAAAIITRGYTGSGGIRRVMDRSVDYDHIGIIVGRALAEERPNNFVYFMVPHRNPGEEQEEWRNFMNSKRVTVASNGRDIKLRIDESA